PREAIMAFELGKIKMHTRVFVRLRERTQIVPDEKSGASAISDVSWKHLEEHRKRRDANYVSKPRPPKFKSQVILTTVGRCIFNDILPREMPFYNYALTAKGASRVIADTYERRGRPATIKLLDDMKALGFKRSTLAALSFGITDIRSPDTKGEILANGQKEADKIEKAYRMAALQNDYRGEDGKPIPAPKPGEKGAALKYLNPIAMMATSGARGNVDQIRQLGGMRGLMAK